MLHNFGSNPHNPFEYRKNTKNLSENNFYCFMLLSFFSIFAFLKC